MAIRDLKRRIEKAEKKLQSIPKPKKKTAKSYKDRWDRYCLEFVKDFDRIRAYRTVYKVKSDAVAKNSAGRLMLSNVYVQEKIKELLAKQEKTAEKSAEEIIQALEDIGFGPAKDSDRIKALELLGKRFGIFPHKIEGKVEVTNLADIAALMRGK